MKILSESITIITPSAFNNKLKNVTGIVKINNYYFSIENYPYSNLNKDAEFIISAIKFAMDFDMIGRKKTVIKIYTSDSTLGSSDIDILSGFSDEFLYSNFGNDFLYSNNFPPDMKLEYLCTHYNVEISLCDKHSFFMTPNTLLRVYKSDT